MNTDKKPAVFRSALNPRPPVIVSCRGADGRDNALAVVYATNCSYDPPMVMVGIVPSRFSHHMIKETGVFVVNLASVAQKNLFTYFGTHSGRDGDKMSASGATIIEGVKVNAPVLADCPVSIECTVVDSIVTGSHEMFVGKIEYVHADAPLVKADGTIDWKQIEFYKV